MKREPILPPLFPTYIIVEGKSLQITRSLVVSITDVNIIPWATCVLGSLCRQFIWEVSITKIPKTRITFCKRCWQISNFKFTDPSRWFVEDSSSIKTFKSPPFEFFVILMFSIFVRSVLHWAIFPNRSDKLILVLALSAEKTTPSLDSLLLEDEELERDRRFCFGSSSIFIRWIGIC